jgi:hypothetical protein
MDEIELAFHAAQDAIMDAIINEDGLDGAKGKEVLTKIEKAWLQYRVNKSKEK